MPDIFGSDGRNDMNRFVNYYGNGTPGTSMSTPINMVFNIPSLNPNKY
jgi:hypothetical protein